MTAVNATRNAPRLVVAESITSGAAPVVGPYDIDISGPDFVSQQPYGGGGDDVHQLAADAGLNVITFTVPGSNVWVEMWIDPDTEHITRETIIDPGHRIEHTISYPTS